MTVRRWSGPEQNYNVTLKDSSPEILRGNVQPSVRQWANYRGPRITYYLPILTNIILELETGGERVSTN